MPWQALSSRYMTAVEDGHWRFPQIGIVAARQNGKTELLLPRIVMDLRAGKRVLHTAHRMRLPQLMFRRLLTPLRKEARIRQGQGQEEIFMHGGGSYAIVASQRGARGDHSDTIIYDEVREFEDDSVLDAVEPTRTASPDGQSIFLSNAGSAASVVLNALRRRGEAGDDRLAYLEWSAAPERSRGDHDGWCEANPALGYIPGLQENLEDWYAGSKDNPAGFDTEHLCRWVDSMQPPLVSDVEFARCHTEILDDPSHPSMGFAVDPTARRCSAVLSWRLSDGRIALVSIREYRGDPLDLDALGAELRKLAIEKRARLVGHAAADKGPARHLRGAKSIEGKEYAAACGTFASLVASGRLAWDGDPLIAEDIAFTARHPYESGLWVAQPTTTERPVTAALAAIRATYLASAPKRIPRIG
jgi:hypothetical protein